MEEEKNVISSENVTRYVDETSDGGFWFTVRGNEAKFVAVTDKALKVLGFSDFEELMGSGVSPYTLIQPISNDAMEKNSYDSFVTKKKKSFNMDCVFISVQGKEYFGEIFIAHSLVFPHRSDEILLRAMIHIYSPTEAIFRQTKQLLDGMNSGVAIIEFHEEDDYRLIYGNYGFCSLIKYDHNSIPDIYGKNVLEHVHEDDISAVCGSLAEAIKTGNNIRQTYRIYDKDHEYSWIKAEHKRIKIGDRYLIYINFINVSDFMDIQDEMQRANNQLSSFLNHTPAGIVIFEKAKDVYKLKEINTTMLEKLNTVKANIKCNDIELTKELLLNHDINVMYEFIDPIDHILVNEIVERAENSGTSECNFKLNPGVDSQSIWIHCKAIARKRSNGAMQLIAVYNDITRQVKAELEIKQKQAEILNMSYRDALTNVLNRQSYNEFIKRRRDTKFSDTGVAFVDVNGLKVINDLYGHSKGDDAIKLTVLLVCNYFEKDEIYRLSGDNFVIIKENIPQELFYRKMGRLISELNKYDIASIGYNWDENVINISHNIDKAESAMRVAKHDYYVRHMEDESKHRPAHLNDLRTDLENGRYVLYLQPKSKTSDKKIIGAEALIRRIESDGTIIPPSAFVPTIEKERLIPYLDFYILNETCKVIERWNGEGRDDIKISVNMSRVTFAEPEYIKRILEITDAYKIKHGQIEFEITESQETMDRYALEQIVVELASLGFGISLDDMGTEYASVMMLTMKGLDTVKIDRGFILQMKSERGRVLVEHIIRMCHDLGEKCIAEGVETDEIREQLLEMGCDMYQGYLLSEPIPVNEFEKLLKNE